MNSEFNPWAAPSPQRQDLPSAVSPLLPVVFRTSIITRLIMVPIGMLMAMMTISTFGTTILLMGDGASVLGLLTSTIAFITGATTFGCFLSCRCKLVLTDSSIHTTEFFSEAIYYSEIKSWHHHPVTGTVNIVRDGQTDYHALSNWAMSRKKSELLGKVLQDKVGPPSGS